MATIDVSFNLPLLTLISGLIKNAIFSSDLVDAFMIIVELVFWIISLRFKVR